MALLASAYIYNLRKQRKQIQAENTKLQDLINNPPFRTEFGVRWTKELIPHCPACSSPLTYTNQAIAAGVGTWGFRCVKCSAFIALNDYQGHNIELNEAKRLLSTEAAGQLSAPALPPAPAPEPELNEDCERLLRIIATPNYEHGESALYQYMSVHPERCKHYLEILEDGNYIYAIRTMMPGSETTYHLDRKGRDYAMKRRWI